MLIDKNSLLSIAAKIGISKIKAKELWQALEEKSAPETAKFDLSHVLYYLGAMIVIIAMAWFVGAGWEHLGGGGILAIALAYIGAFFLAGRFFWNRKGLKVPGGLFITIAVCLIPLAVYGFQKWTGLWIVDEPGQYRDFFSWVKGGWFMMETATIIGGAIAFYFYRFPFLTAPIFFALWFMSMDVTPLLFGDTAQFSDERLRVSIAFGAILIIVSYLIDQRTDEDFAFWGYLFGTMAFWCGLTLLNSSSEFRNFFYCLANIGLLLLAVLLQRTVFLIFGALGILSYITALFYRYFSDSFFFPLILSLIGVLVVIVGMVYHKNRSRIESYILNLIPESAQKWLPRSRK
jgi:hypothetical protein